MTTTHHAGEKPPAIASYTPVEAGAFTSARARWRIHGTSYEVDAEELEAFVGPCFAQHPDAEVILAARPFAADAPSVLMVGSRTDEHDEAASAGDPADARTPHPVVDTAAAQPFPSRETFEERVAEAITAMKSPQIPRDRALEKVVLGRRILLPLASGVTARNAAQMLQRGLASEMSPGYGFSLPLSHGGALVGRSPELLLRRTGQTVETTPLAGSLPRTGDPEEDDQGRRRLLASAKDLREHHYVVSAVLERLRTVCTTVDASSSPEIFETPTMLHLGTHIRGELAGDRARGVPALGVFALAELLHPTPAVCGTPTGRARDLIAELEELRGYFTGLVGWQNRHGDGETAVTIRCAEITPEAVEVFAGAGIISDSVPAAEADETLAKMRTVLRALNAEEVSG